MLKKHSQFWASILILVDLFVIICAWIAAFYVRFLTTDVIKATSFRGYMILLLPILFIWPFIFRNMGLYRGRRITAQSTEVLDILKASTLAIFILIATTFFIHKYNVSRLFLVYFWSFSILFLIFERWVFRNILRLLRRKGYNFRVALIIGAGDLGKKIKRKIKDNPWAGLEVIGYLDDYKKVDEIVEGKAILGRIKDIAEIVDKFNVDQVFLALPIRSYNKYMYIMESLGDKMVDIRIVPDIYQAITLNASVENFEGLPLINLTDTPMYGWNAVLKRIADIIVALAAIIITGPVMILISLFIRLTSTGPILFKQRRYGLDGRVIRIYKFRTMTVCEDGPDIPQAKRHDCRITKLGTLLRKTSLDELPQFFNVLQGRMSVVGPRPHAVAHNELYRKLIRNYMLRHKVKPGITGWAQVNGCRGETDTVEKMEKRVQHDIYYIEHWSIAFDLRIILLTVWSGLVNKNAY
jgi:Undecaprenyl-phosphate glucose phosphotransferase